jgi:hypothetical protein
MPQIAVLMRLSYRKDVNTMKLYTEDNTTYLDAPCACNMCLESQKVSTGHYACDGIDGFLYGLYEKGFITNSFIDGQWRWVVLDVTTVGYLMTFYEKIKKLVVE